MKIAPSGIPELESPESPNIDPNVELVPQPMHDKAKVKFSGLAKRFGDGKLAVKNLATAMLEGQITCLLGHNGAGSAPFIFLFHYNIVIIRKVHDDIDVNGDDRSDLGDHRDLRS